MQSSLIGFGCYKLRWNQLTGNFGSLKFESLSDLTVCPLSVS